MRRDLDRISSPYAHHKDLPGGASSSARGDGSATAAFDSGQPMRAPRTASRMSSFARASRSGVP